MLLENFVSSSEEDSRLADEHCRIEEGLNPLHRLVHFISLAFEDNNDLTQRIQSLFKLLDCDCAGAINDEQFCAQLRQLTVTDRVFGWLILESEGVCAHERMLSGSQKGLFSAWTVFMSLSGFAIIVMIGHSISKREDGCSTNSYSPVIRPLITFRSKEF